MLGTTRGNEMESDIKAGNTGYLPMFYLTFRRANGSLITDVCYCADTIHGAINGARLALAQLGEADLAIVSYHCVD